jgi:sugar phosphate isomerase/epimerase
MLGAVREIRSRHRDETRNDLMRRREALKTLAALPCLGAALLAADDPPAATPPRCSMGLVIHSFAVRRPRPLTDAFGPIATPLEFAQAAARFGAGGIQTSLPALDDNRLRSLRETLERHKLFLEGIVALPKDEGDASRFEADLKAAQAAGATVVRTVCLSGRRYETFETGDQFRQFAERSLKSLQLAEPLARKYRIGLAVENHKDWRMDEMLGWLQRLDSEYVGVCLDTGNSMALLEEPHEVVEAYAPWTFTTHVKDMAVAEYDDGFLLAEVPLGKGTLDLPRIVSTLRKARPGVRLNLEMITRDPLRVPCLTDKYWATLGDVRGSELAEALSRVRSQKSRAPLPVVSTLEHRAQLEREATNITESLRYARDTLKL